jgi:hypothetical protein
MQSIDAFISVSTKSQKKTETEAKTQQDTRIHQRHNK